MVPTLKSHLPIYGLKISCITPACSCCAALLLAVAACHCCLPQLHVFAARRCRISKLCIIAAAACQKPCNNAARRCCKSIAARHSSKPIAAHHCCSPLPHAIAAHHCCMHKIISCARLPCAINVMAREPSLATVKFNSK